MEKRRFHELLEAHLRASGYTNYEFARITGINRVNIQRYLAGTRLPDPQIFEAIRRELRLGVREHRELQEAYYRAMDGDDVYFMRCMIRRMLEEAGNICGMEAGFETTPEPPGQISAPGMRTINGVIAVERYLWSAIWENLSAGRKNAYFYVPAESCILARLLLAFSLDGRSAMGHLNIVQLVRLSKRAEDSAGDYHNLRAVYNLIPTYYQAGAAYETWYYYHDHPSGGRDEAVLYPYYGILDDRVILFSGNMDQAVVAYEPEVTDAYRRSFFKVYKNGRNGCLARYFRDIFQVLDWMLKSDNGPVSRCFLEYQPCFVLWADRELAERVAAPGLPGRSLVIDGIMKRREQVASGAELIHYFTEDGLREFAENGRFADYPEEYVRALTREERVRILDGMLADMERPGCDMGIVKEQSLHLTKMLNIFVSSAVGASLVLYDPEQGFHQLLIQEPSITQAFDTYIRGMRDHGEVYSREETEAIVRKYRDGLKDGGTVAGTP